MRLLALDTSSAQCSAALLFDGALQFRAVATARDHAQLLLPMVDELLGAAGVALGDLEGIAFGRGPGSFTGVRIAAAVTQGLAAGAQLPVLPVSSLRALALQAQRRVLESGATLPDSALLACMDARMGELYWGLFPQSLEAAGEYVGPVRQLLATPDLRVAVAAGRGLAAYPDVAVSLQLTPQRTLDDAEPHAADVARLAAKDLAQGGGWLDAALAQPVYLRDQVVHGATGR